MDSPHTDDTQAAPTQGGVRYSDKPDWDFAPSRELPIAKQRTAQANYEEHFKAFIFWKLDEYVLAQIGRMAAEVQDPENIHKFVEI